MSWRGAVHLPFLRAIVHDSMLDTIAKPIAVACSADAEALATPLLPDDYLGYLNPLWSRREPRGIVEAVLPETADAATIWCATPRIGPHTSPVNTSPSASMSRACGTGGRTR